MQEMQILSVALAFRLTVHGVYVEFNQQVSQSQDVVSAYAFGVVNPIQMKQRFAAFRLTPRIPYRHCAKIPRGAMRNSTRPLK